MTTPTPDNSPRDTAPGPPGLTEARPEPVLLIACGALAREILDLKARNGWDHMDLVCLPANLHNRPDKIPDAVRRAVARHRANVARIYVVYADCGTGGLLQKACDEMGVDMIPGPHCYAFFDGLERFETRDEITAFFLTDFLVRQFDAFVWKPLGLDRHPDLRDMYFSHYDRLVYLAQTDDPALDKAAKSHAARLGLRYERRSTGYGDLTHHLSHWAAQ